MVTMDTDVDELCSLLLDLGGQIEESSRFLETMSEMLMKGKLYLFICLFAIISHRRDPLKAEVR